MLGVFKNTMVVSRLIVGIRPFGVGRRFDVMLPRPSPMLRRRETAAMLPAFLGGLTSAWIVLAGEGDVSDLDLRGWKRAAKRCEAVR
jgi:hypothetical protein